MGMFRITICIQDTFHFLSDINREVSLHVKRERKRVTSHSGAQFRYTSRSRKLLGFVSHRDVSTEEQGYRYQQMSRQQSTKHARSETSLLARLSCLPRLFNLLKLGMSEICALRVLLVLVMVWRCYTGGNYLKQCWSDYLVPYMAAL